MLTHLTTTTMVTHLSTTIKDNPKERRRWSNKEMDITNDSMRGNGYNGKMEMVITERWKWFMGMD
jgi:hypothetical protein